jgi:hypothetical protein
LNSCWKIKIANFLLWQIVIRKYLAEWMKAGAIQRTEKIQRIIDLEPVCLLYAETYLEISTTNFDLFLSLQFNCVYL